MDIVDCFFVFFGDQQTCLVVNYIWCAVSIAGLPHVQIHLSFFLDFSSKMSEIISETF